LKKNKFWEWFQEVYDTVPAYRHYVDKHNVKIENFHDVPVIDKKSYINHYPLNELFSHGAMPSLGHSSSGSTGAPTFWFRGEKQTKIGKEIYREIFTDIFEIKKNEPTLVIICFAMGVWVAGSYTLIACQKIAEEGHNLTIFPTGMDLQIICRILKESAPFFEHVILIGYPFFLDVVFGEVEKQSIPIHKSFFIVTAGDKFSEQWRISMLNKIGKPLEYYNRIINVYGTSDAGILGYETPFSIFIKQKAIKNLDLYKMIFGDSDPSVIPTLIQYDPDRTFFEVKDGELLLSTNIDCPLIRYNIHDRGRVINFTEMKKMLASCGINYKSQDSSGKSMPLKPFVVVDTRTDVAITFNAVKIYPEQIRAGITDPKIAHILSGSFKACIKKDLNLENRIHLTLELVADLNEITTAIKQEISYCIIEHLKSCNSEYRAVYTACSDLATPMIDFSLYNPNQFLECKPIEDQPVLINIVGKKTKLLKPELIVE